MPGYILGVPWEQSYQLFLNPHYTRFTLGVAGIEAPAIKTCCELAYGKGLSVTLHAACNRGMLWTGTDFNPSLAAFAVKLTAGTGLNNLCLTEEPIASYCRREDLTKFDMVAMTGIWSWLPESDQDAVGYLLRTKLNSKGLFCIDHLTLPGMNSMTALRRLMIAFAGDEGQSESESRFTEIGVRRAIDRTLAFLDTQPNFLHHHWSLRSWVEKMLETNPAMLLHEYFNYNWQPRYLFDTADLLERFGVSWVASWSLAQALTDLHFTPRQIAYLSTAANPLQGEQLKDFMVNRSSRADIWSRGLTPQLSPCPSDNLRAERVILAVPKEKFDYKAKGALGGIALSRGLYARLLDALGHHQPVSVTELEEKLRNHATYRELIDALTILIRQQILQVVNLSDSEIVDSSPASRAINRNILEVGREGDLIGCLGSPVTGGGVKVSSLHQLFLLAREEGARSPSQYVRFTQDVLVKLDHEASDLSKQIIPDRLDVEAEDFDLRHLAIYRALGMIETT